MIKSETMVLLLAVGWLSACTSWTIQSASPQQVLAEHQPEKVRVTRADSTTVVLNQPEIAGDTLYGMGQSQASGGHADRSGVALADVKSVAIRKGDATKTVLLGVGSAAVGVGTLYLIAALAYANSSSVW